MMVCIDRAVPAAVTYHTLCFVYLSLVFLMPVCSGFQWVQHTGPSAVSWTSGPAGQKVSRQHTCMCTNGRLWQVRITVQQQLLTSTSIGCHPPSLQPLLDHMHTVTGHGSTGSASC
jgi:hypothetical protein